MGGTNLLYMNHSSFNIPFLDIDSEDDVEMLPMENVRLTWKGESFSSDAPGRFQDNWRSNTGSQDGNLSIEKQTNQES